MTVKNLNNTKLLLISAAILIIGCLANIYIVRPWLFTSPDFYNFSDSVSRITKLLTINSLILVALIMASFTAVRSIKSREYIVFALAMFWVLGSLYSIFCFSIPIVHRPLPL